MKTIRNPLRKLSKLQLLELLARQERELQSLRETLKRQNAELEDRRIRLEQAGSIAEAALKINGVFEAAQKAADQYIFNLQRKAKEQNSEGARRK